MCLQFLVEIHGSFCSINPFNYFTFQLIHGLVDRIMEAIGAPFVSVGDESGYYLKPSDVSSLFHALALLHGNVRNE